MDPNFSITLFVYSYNHEKYIKEAIKGALNQDITPYEIIISDDSSTDNTWQIITEESQKYDGIAKLILNRNEQNLGITSHLNKIASMGSGDWFVLCAGDDISLPDRLTVLSEAIKKYPEARFIATGFNVIDENGQFLYYQGFNSIHPYPTGATGAWHRSCFDYFGPISESTTAEDVVIPFRALLKGEVILINQPTIQYRIHGQSVSSPLGQDLIESWNHLIKIKYHLINACRQRINDMARCSNEECFNICADLKNRHTEIIKGFQEDITNITGRLAVMNMTISGKIKYLFTRGESKHKSFLYRLKTIIISFGWIRKLIPDRVEERKGSMAESVKIIRIPDLMKPETGLLIYL